VFPKCIKSKPKIDEAIFLGGTNNLMHFTIEEIPKLYQLSLMNLPVDIPLIIRNDLSIQIREMFEALSSRKLIFIENYEDIPVGQLHIIQLNNPLRKSMSGDEGADEALFNSTAMEWARARCQDLVPKSKGITRIQITRERGLFRQLTNVDKLSLLLKKEFNFHPIFTGNSNLETAVAQFRDANIVIGEYGAGLANILFCHPGSIVIEIRGPAERNAREYYLLCRSLSIKHFLIAGNKRNLSKYGLGNGQFEIEVEDLMEMVRTLVVDRAS
jgi:capsular polysaccharide biosynthesis protein